MIIRKKFKFEGAHIVRNCSTDRCKRSIHGHSYEVELFFTANKLDNGQMIMDFGLMKNNIKDIIDSFDHTIALWANDDLDYINTQKKYSARWIVTPMSPSAESFALMFLHLIDVTLKQTDFKNGEGDVKIHSVRVHETDTGYAEAFREDLDMIHYKLSDIIFSEQVQLEWKEQNMFQDLCKKEESHAK